MAPLRPSQSLVSHPLLRGGFTLVGLLAVVACTDQDPSPSDPGGGFISYVPGSGNGERSSGDGDAVLDAAGESPSAGDGDGDDGEAERAISEADILQVDGDRLYALSRFSGLSVIDISNPADLQMLGSYRTSATPFEMYLEGSIVYVMFNGWASYVYDEQGDFYTWETTSRMQAIDVSDPSNIRLLGDREIPGEIADSRKVGDIIYLATHQAGYCWGCDDVANSRVTSFDVSTPEDFTPVDSVAFQTEEGWQRSISVTQDRIYVSGWVWNEEQAGTIDVVDISDPSGAMQKGTSVKIAGQIQSRWQMEEHEGVLRVISQPGGWGTTNPPVVETFQVVSADEITPLASLEMVLPRPESLRSVRYDGDRAYAITFEQTDPLFTFDLSDPADPRQVGELEIPGWVYHMEPRGDRIYALGFDDAAEEGSLHVSLFDVSDLANPTMLDRVNFGGNWGGFAEDQDRIHKAFNILPDQGLITVPFYGGSYSDDSCTWSYGGGIQLVDMTTEDLTLRGVAPQVGQARRALYHNDTLFGISDNAVQTFDISNRDAPKKVGQLLTARNVQNIRVMGSTMLRFGSDWWTEQATLDFASLESADSAESLGELDLAAFIEEDEENCDTNYSWSYWGGQVFVHGSYAYVPRYEEKESESAGDYRWASYLTLYIVDISERTAPRLAGKFELDPAAGDADEYYAGIIQTDKALLVGRQKSKYVSGGLFGGSWESSFSYDVVDLSDPEAPTVVERFAVPDQLGAHGWGYGFEGCSIDMGWGWWGYYGGPNALTSGNLVVSQHAEPLEDGSGRVRYYMDRLDVSDPEHPSLLPSVNIPGKVVDFDHESGRIVTIDYAFVETMSGEDACYTQGLYAEFDELTRTCRTYRRKMHVLFLSDDEAVLKDSHLIDEDAVAGSIAISEGKVFYNPVNYAETGEPTQSVVVLNISADGNISKQGEVGTTGPYWWGSLVARGDRAFLTMDNQLTVIDATGSDVTAQNHEMGGWWCNELEVHEDTAYCAMGQFGVRSFPLD